MNETSELTPEERLAEIAKILARGILRLQDLRLESKTEPQATNAILSSDSTQTIENGKPSRNQQVFRWDKQIAGLAPLLARDMTPTVTPQVPPPVSPSTELDLGES